MNHLLLIIKREYLTKVRNKSFIVMTFLSPIIFIGLVLIVSYLSQLNHDKIQVVNVLDESELLEGVFKNSKSTHYNVLTGLSLKDAKSLSEASESYGLLHIHKNKDIASTKVDFYSVASPSIVLISELEQKIQKELTIHNRINKGIDVKALNDSKVSVKIAYQSFQGEKTSQMDGILKLVFGGATGYLLFMFIVIYGNMIMRSVIEEKTSRIIEVIISSVKPLHLMLGKIIGTTLAGISQFIVWVVLGGVFMTITSLIFGINFAEVKAPQQEVMLQTMGDSEINSIIESVLASIQHLPIVNLVLAFIFFFIGGYLLYSSIYAAIGAVVDNETDTQQFVFPVLMPLVLAVYVGLFTVIGDPHGTISVVFSYIPFTSPVVMLMRIPFGVPVWQQLVSLMILIGTFSFVIWFASKIYRIGILTYGKKPSYKELIKWIKY